MNELKPNRNTVNEQCPKLHIPHFTAQTDRLRSKTPQNKTRLIKQDGTYFTKSEQEEFWYELDKLFEWMQDQEKQEREGYRNT